MQVPIAVWRSTLFVPATRPERFAKAAGASADLVCIDLEDAVAPADKEAARETALTYLAAPPPGRTRWLLRVNSPRTLEGLQDLLALCTSPAAPDGIVLPKTASADEVRWLDDLLARHKPAARILPIIESGTGLEQAPEIAGATSRVAAIGFGSADLAAEIGCDMSWDALAYGRGRMVAAASQAGVAAVDGVWLTIADTEGLRDETRRVARLGFAGKIAIHPSQVPVINQAFLPDRDEQTRARRIVDAADATTDGVITVDGRMIDAPVIAAARRILAIAAAAETMGDDLP